MKRFLIASLFVCTLAMSGVFVYFSAPSNVDALTMGKTPTPPASSSLMNGLVGWWTFDGGKLSLTTATDSSGLGNHGTISGSRPYPTSGRVGQGARFTRATNEYISIPAHASHSDLAAITVAGWVKVSSFGAASNHVVSKGAGASVPSNGWIFRILNTGALDFRVGYTDALFDLRQTSNTGVIAPGAWVHVAATWNGSPQFSGVRLYANGQEVDYQPGSDAQGSRESDSGQELRIGNSSGSGAPFGGIMDDIRLYNRALSAAEIKKLYQGGQVTIPTSGVTRTLDDPANDVGTHSSIAIGTNGNPVVSYYDSTAGALKLFVCDNPTCTSGTARTLDDPANDVGTYSSITIGADGNPVISYMDTDSASLKLYICDNSACESGSARDLYSNALGYTSVKIGAGGSPMVSFWYANTLGLSLFVCDDATCASGNARILENPTNAVGIGSTLAIGRSGNPVISHFDLTARSIRLYVCDDPTCTNGTARTLYDPSDLLGQFTSVVIGGDGNPMISFTNGTRGSLMLFVCSDPTCTGGATRTLEVTANRIALHSSIAIGTNGNPVVSYYDSKAGALKLFACDNPTCTSGIARTLDDPANSSVGTYSSIAAGRDGYPVISYHDGTARSLKLFKCSDRTCGPVTSTGKSQPSLIPNGLVGYWSFNGPDLSTTTAFDRSGQNNHGTLLGTPKPKPAAGKVGQGLRFLPTNLYSQVPQTATINDLSRKTIVAWIRPLSFGELGANRFGVIMEKGGEGFGWSFRVSDVGGSSLYFLSEHIIAPGRWRSNLPIRLGDWQHVAVTYDDSADGNDPLFYWNGAQATSTEISAPFGPVLPDALSNLLIGNTNGANMNLDGTLDEVRIYNRILTPAEIKKLYQAGR